ADELAYLRRQHDALAEQAGSQTEVQPELRDLERRITRLLEELRLTGADDLERLSLLEGRVYSPQALLEPGTALLEFYRVGTDHILFVMDRDSLRAIRLDNAAVRLSRLEGALALNLRTATTEPDKRALLEPNMRALLKRVYDVLLRPVEDWLR